METPTPAASKYFSKKIEWGGLVVDLCEVVREGFAFFLDEGCGEKFLRFDPVDAKDPEIGFEFAPCCDGPNTAPVFELKGPDNAGRGFVVEGPVCDFDLLPGTNGTAQPRHVLEPLGGVFEWVNGKAKSGGWGSSILWEDGVDF